MSAQRTMKSAPPHAATASRMRSTWVGTTSAGGSSGEYPSPVVSSLVRSSPADRVADEHERDHLEPALRVVRVRSAVRANRALDDHTQATNAGLV
jgi:hypothetical protein